MTVPPSCASPVHAAMPSEPASMSARCSWCGSDPLYIAYHDQEWGVPQTDERLLFEFLVLEGAQAGLSWITILKKRERYRQVFGNFEPAHVAAFAAADIDRLLADAGIVRNRLKIESAIGNAHAFLELQAGQGSFARWLWDFVDGRPIVNHWTDLKQVPAATALSQQLSRELKRAGFGFVGPTIVYAYLQAVGLVNDHLVSCPRHAECASMQPDWN